MTEKENNMENSTELKHQVVCSNCGMVYELRYIAEFCRFREHEGYICMNCEEILDLSE